jgi:uncharacterized membrane protein YqaE (UPF0057 family)
VNNVFLAAVVGFFVPPVGVFLRVGATGAFWLNLLLCVFFWVPAQLHAAWVSASLRRDGRDHPEAGSRFVALVLAPALPPLAVLVRRGLGTDLLVNCVLCCFLWFPGTLHAAWVAVDE